MIQNISLAQKETAELGLLLKDQYDLLMQCRNNIEAIIAELNKRNNTKSAEKPPKVKSKGK